MVVGEDVDFKMRKKYQVKLLPSGLKQFTETAPVWINTVKKQIKDVYYDGLWLMYVNAKQLKEEGEKKAIAILKDGLLFAERSCDKEIARKFLMELKVNHEDVE